MKTRKVYKIVTPKLESGFLPSFNYEKNKVTYLMNGVTVAPPGTKLFVFDTLENAKVYIGNVIWGLNLLIFQAEATGVSKPKLTTTSFSFINSYWKFKKQKKKLPYDMVKEPPKGTLFADTVKLIQQVD